MTEALAVLKERYLERYADVLFWGLKTARRGRFRKGNVILIQYDPAALRLAEILYGKILAAGMNPIQRMGLTIGMERSFFGKSGGRQLVFQPPGEKELCGNLHGRIYLHAPDSLTHLKDVDPTRIGKVLVARKPRHPRKARAGGILRLDSLHAADGGACRAGTDDAGNLRRADHPGLLPGSERPGR